ncbi:MAG: (((gamma-L-glutamylamino)ethyl phenoxymethyl)furan-2-yl)methanamine synthase [Gemmatimonadales bacterium]|nr:(((gamma-L-glutamylamino)ethyl phenoxymethyl)furan-2-yl)methanamine synthase [Gemmatimonadales bacterium]
MSPAILGWDIGGVNTKVTRLEAATDGPVIRSMCLPFELKHDPDALTPTLTEAARAVGGAPGDLHAVTMTAELSQAFRTKREGVGFVLDALEVAFPEAMLYVYTVEGRFVTPPEARTLPLSVGAANWAATARLVARSVPTCILLDVGTTSTDLIPIVHGQVVVQGYTDPARLLSGELVYTGALRTPVEAVAPQVPLWGGSAGVSADGFALIGDAHLWLGRLSPGDYTCPTPDGRPPTREFAGERLARTVCADRDMLDDSALDAIAGALACAQVRAVATALERILERWPVITTAVVAGLGDFIAVEAAETAGLDVVRLADRLGQSARTAPAAAVAWLLWHTMEAGG